MRTNKPKKTSSEHEPQTEPELDMIEPRQPTNSPPDAELGDKLRMRRESEGLNLKQEAWRLGVGVAQITDWERGVFAVPHPEEAR